jgi:L-asparaginase/Glu-tRNA(Gln) amidotransferase subunit D
VCLIKTNPGLRSDQLSKILELFDGAVLEGTGIGHLRVDDGVLNAVQDFAKPDALSTQCLSGGESDLEPMLWIRKFCPFRT